MTPPVLTGLTSLPVLGDDLYLRMQALNLAVVDEFLRDQESNLLRTYFEIERTPMPEAVFVSAVSQLWIFGLYELLRTWRQRARSVLTFAAEIAEVEGEARDRCLENLRGRLRSSSAYPEELDGFFMRAFERVAEEPDLARRVRVALDSTEVLYRQIEALRVHLAKHEMPGVRGSFAMAPGYGRISMENGSIYWQVSLPDNEVDVTTRVALADACARLAEDRSAWILPPEVQRMVEPIRRLAYAVKRIKVRLRDGTEYGEVYVAWNREVLSVGRFEEMPFDVNEITGVEADHEDQIDR